MSKPGIDWWLNVKNLQLYRAISLKYVRETSDVEYAIENYDNEVKCKAEDERDQIISNCRSRKI